MYDVRNERHEFVGEDREDAVSKACEYFEVEADQLKISELETGKVYGLASRVAVVAELVDRRPPEGGGGGGGGRREGRSDRGDRGDRGGRGGRGGRGDRGDRGDRGGRGGRGGRGNGRGRAEAASEGGAGEEPAAPSAPSVGTADGEIGEVGAFLLGVVERMDLGPFSISETSDDDSLLVYQISGEAGPGLAGSDGRPVDALQLLANQAAGQVSDDPPRVVVDVEGDTDAREDRLSKLAQRAARRALDTGNSVRLDPMNGKDRRLIHLALRDEEDVATMSTGEGRYRQVVVVPEGAPEFEEAQRESGRASERMD